MNTIQQFTYAGNAALRAQAFAGAMFYALTHCPDGWCIYHTLADMFVVQTSIEPSRGVLVASSQPVMDAMVSPFNNRHWEAAMVYLATQLHSIELGALADAMAKLKSFPEERIMLNSLMNNLISEFESWKRYGDSYEWGMTYEPCCKMFVSERPHLYPHPQFITSRHFINVWLPGHPEARDMKPKELAKVYMNYLVNESNDWWDVNMKIRKDRSVPCDVFIKDDADLMHWKEIISKRRQ